MRQGICKLLITGGAGFMGSALVRLAIKKGYRIVIVDKLTYAGDTKRLEDSKARCKFYKVDICDGKAIDAIFKKEKPDSVVNFAAHTHVDKSIQDPSVFIETNVVGSGVLFRTSRKYKVDRFLQVSTDEVYGDIKKGAFSEGHPLRPSSPYSATKASADLLLKSYIRTFQFPGIIVRPSNNYGPWQHPEKFIPWAILNILRNKKVPVYGKGTNVREWLYVDDCAQAILAVLEKGKVGEIYNIGSDQEEQNIAVAKALLKILNANERLIGFVEDRAGHDIRYRLDCRKMREEIGWLPRVRFEEGLHHTVQWYLAHKNWLFSKGKNAGGVRG